MPSSADLGCFVIALDINLLQDQEDFLSCTEQFFLYNRFLVYLELILSKNKSIKSPNSC